MWKLILHLFLVMKSYFQALLTSSICLNMLKILMHIYIHYSLLLPQLPLLGIINGYSNLVMTKLLNDTFHVCSVCFCKCYSFVLRCLIMFFLSHIHYNFWYVTFHWHLSYHNFLIWNYIFMVSLAIIYIVVV